MTNPTANDDFTPPPDKWREVRYRHTANLPSLLREANCSLLVSTYQAGKLLAIGTTGGENVEGKEHRSGMSAADRRGTSTR